jgi:hypothetical protein
VPKKTKQTGVKKAQQAPPSIGGIEPLANATLAVLRQSFPPDCALNAARILQDVLARYDIESRALSVNVAVGNGIWAEDVERLGRLPEKWEFSEGAAALGKVGEAHRTDVGHVVVIVGGDVLVDLTTSQFVRPDLGILPPPALIEELPPRWLTGTFPFGHVWSDTALFYQARPSDRRFEQMADYQPNAANQKATLAITSALAITAGN